MPRTELELLRTRFWEYQLKTERYKRRVHNKLLHLDSQVAEAHQKIESLIETTRKLAAIIEHRLGEKLPPPVISKQQRVDIQIEDERREELYRHTEYFEDNIFSLQAKLQVRKSELIYKEQRARANGEIINVDKPLEELVREVLRDNHKISPREEYSSRKPKRKRYTPQRCVKKED